MIANPLHIPLDGGPRRKITLQRLGDTMHGRGTRFLVIEIHTADEDDAVTAWLDHRAHAAVGVST